MNKKSDNNISTERILKSKYLDRDKQKTIPLLKSEKSKNKIKLVDLCPEEKLKIGELIKTLEARRLENEELRQEIEQLRSNLEVSQQQAERLAEERLNEQRIVGELRAEIEGMKEEIERGWLRNEELERVVKEYGKVINRRNKAKSKSIQTQSALTVDKCVGMQNEVRSIDTQTQKQQQQQRTRDLFYRPHSKSFQKIMKGSFLNVQTTPTQPHQRSQARPNTKSNHTDKVMQSHSHSPQNQDQFIQELHMKWDQLKAKNRNLPSNSPHSFNASSQKESSRKQSKIDEIDEVSLNKMLRLKDFSASKLMRMGKDANSQSKKQESPEVNYLKSPYFNRLQPTQLSQPKRHPHNPKKSPPGSQQPINFYESDLFE